MVIGKGQFSSRLALAATGIFALGMLLSFARPAPVSAEAQCVDQVFGFSYTQKACVSYIQGMLNAISIPGSSNDELVVDGKYGPKTTARVKEFQRAEHLAADGVVGPQTWGFKWPYRGLCNIHYTSIFTYRDQANYNYYRNLAGCP